MFNNILIFFGAGIGGLLRYWISTATYSILGRQFPYGTLVVNITGCFLMGLLFIVIQDRFADNAPQLRALLLIGFLGGYTTFSSFSIETMQLIESGNWSGALTNIFLSVVICIGGAWMGLIAGRSL